MDDTLLELVKTPLTAQVLLSTILGSQMPLLVAWVARYVTSPVQKVAIVIGSSLVAGFLLCWVLGLLNWQNIMLSLLLIWFVTDFVYKKYWKTTSVTDRIEGKTNPASVTAGDHAMRSPDGDFL